MACSGSSTRRVGSGWRTESEGSQVRPLSVIGIDVDEVLAELHAPWVAWGNKTFGTSKSVGDFDHWDAPIKWWGEEYSKFLTPDIYEQDVVKPYDGALAAVEMIREMGHGVCFVTSCSPGSESAKFQWLVRHGFAKDSDEFIPGRDKSHAPCHILVDDGYHNVSTFKGWAILLNRPHNARDLWFGARINHLAEVYPFIR
jgi:5'(3')-deoxyribonucleotidase